MELAHQCRIRRMVLRAHWLPRLENEEADALTNFEFRHFVRLEDLKFVVLNDLFEEGERYITELEKVRELHKKAKDASDPRGGKRFKGLKGNTLKDHDRW